MMREQVYELEHGIILLDFLLVESTMSVSITAHSHKPRSLSFTTWAARRSMLHKTTSPGAPSSLAWSVSGHSMVLICRALLRMTVARAAITAPSRTVLFVQSAKWGKDCILTGRMIMWQYRTLQH